MPSESTRQGSPRTVRSSGSPADSSVDLPDPAFASPPRPTPPSPPRRWSSVPAGCVQLIQMCSFSPDLWVMGSGTGEDRRLVAARRGRTGSPPPAPHNLDPDPDPLIL